MPFLTIFFKSVKGKTAHVFVFTLRPELFLYRYSACEKIASDIVKYIYVIICA